ncbi:MAG: caspase family protein [Saprospiraceae bacterium]
MKYRFLLFIVLLPFLTLAQNDQPILTLDMEMHTAIIYRFDIDDAGKYVLSCSQDKTAKLWSTRTGKLLQTYRPPIGKGNEGRLYAAAISPNGKYVVIGGWSKNQNNDIYIFNTQSGILMHRIGGLGNVIFDLEFSKDGQYLVAALGGTQGIRVYNSSSWTLKEKDTNYGERSENVTFAPNGDLATVCRDGFIRLYDSNFKLQKKEKTIGGKKPFSVTFSPNGKLLAIGYDDSPTLQVLDATTLKVLYEPNITSANTKNQRLSNITFSKDGQQLIAVGFYSKKQTDGSRWHLLRIWDKQGKGNYQDYPVADDTVLDIKILKNGNIIFAGAQPDWGIIEKNTGKKLIYQSAPLNGHAKSDRSHFKINRDGSQIGLTPHNENPVTFDINTRQIIEQAATYPSYHEKLGEVNISNWKSTYVPKLNGETLSFLKKYETCRSVDIAQHEQTIVFGTEWGVYALDSDGKKIWRTPTQGTAWAVNIAANNKVVASCQGDGTVRWYRMSDGELLLTLFIHPELKRWVLWTPSGYYDASAGAEEFIGWHVNQGEDTEALYYPISKFRSTYYRPDVIDRILQTVDETKALQLANKAANRSTSKKRDIVEKLPPTVRILSPTTGTDINTNNIELEYSIKSPNKEKVTAVKILIDGRPIENERGLKASGKRHKINIRVPSRNCTVSVIAENRFGSSPTSHVDLVWQGQLELSMKPNLYILAVGVGDYDDDKYDLDFPDDDAKAFVKVLEKQEGVLYNQVVAKLYTDKDATKDNILDGLDWLVKETTQRDVAMLFFAGHGVEDSRGTFYYLPVDANENSKRRTCLMEADIQETVSVVTGKIVVFMDACHSGSLMLASSSRRGNPDISRIVNELIEAENGAVVFSSSTGRQSSLEDSRWGHGAFTKALVEGLDGKAQIPDEDGKITCKSLDLYITNRVKQLTNGEQTPTTNYPPNVPDFPISIKK